MPKQVLDDDTPIIIPQDLEAALLDIPGWMPAEQMDWFKTQTEQTATALSHHGLGQWMRNNWGFWSKEGPLYNYLHTTFGLDHADDMSGIILTSLHRRLNNLDLRLDDEVAIYKNHWAEMEKLMPNAEGAAAKA